MIPSQNPDSEEKLESENLKKRFQVRFGEKLRAAREEKGMTLKAVANACGVSESLVSQIERNHVSPAIDTLLSLADALDINLEFLFEDYQKRHPVHIIRKNERPVINEDGILYEKLAKTEGSGKRDCLESYVIKIPCGGKTHHGSYGHAGEEFGVIVKGKAKLKYDKNEYFLEEGDSVSYPANCAHVIENVGDTELNAIWVVTPPQRFTDE